VNGSVQAVQISGVPASISRKAYEELIKSLGFELTDLMALRFEQNGIYATVAARDPAGRKFTADGQTLAVHEVCILIDKEESK
jgi:hypothetical protein